MGNSFSSVTARLGLDTSGWKSGLASALNQAQEFSGKFSKMLKAGGLRGPAKFLGVGALVYGAKEALNLAIERTKELADNQDKNIQKAFKFAEALRGTAEGAAAWSKAVNFSDRLDESTKGVLRFQSALKDTKETAADLAVKGLGSIVRKSEEAGRVLRFLLDVLPKSVGGIGLTQIQAGVNYAQGKNKDENSAINQQQNDAQLQASHEQAVAQAHFEKEKANIAREQRVAELAGRPVAEQQQYYAGEQLRIQAALKNETLLKNEAAKEGVSYEDKILEYLREEAQVTAKLGDLGKTRREQAEQLAEVQQNVANAQKGEIDFAEQLLQIDRKIAEAKYNLGDESPEAQIKYGKILSDLLHERTTVIEHQREVADKMRTNAATLQVLESKNVSLVKEQLAARQEVVAAQIESDKYNFSGTSTEEQRVAAQDKLIDAKQREAAIEHQIIETKKEGRNLQLELIELTRRHATELREKLAPSESDIRSGARGQQSTREGLSRADALQRQAEELYDRSVDESIRGNHTKNPDQRNRDFAQSARDINEASRLSGEADKIRSGLQTKESLQSALTEQTFKENAGKIIASINELKALLQPSPY